MIERPGYYDLDYDKDRKLVRMNIYGFWTVGIVESFGQDIARMIALAGAECDNLIDSRRAEIHSPDVGEALTQLAKSETQAFRGRIAILAESALTRMQNRRFLGMERFGYFETEEAALAWLRSK